MVEFVKWFFVYENHNMIRLQNALMSHRLINLLNRPRQICDYPRASRKRLISTPLIRTQWLIDNWISFSLLTKNSELTSAFWKFQIEALEIVLFESFEFINKNLSARRVPRSLAIPNPPSCSTVILGSKFWNKVGIVFRLNNSVPVAGIFLVSLVYFQTSFKFN